MTLGLNLESYLESQGTEPLPRAAARTVASLAEAAREIAALLARGPLAGDLGAASAARNADGDDQKALDVAAHEIMMAALGRSPVAHAASEEQEEAMLLDAGAPLAVAVDPLDGSSNIDTNVSVGAIFSILPAVPGDDPLASFLQPGSRQVGAGFFIFGPCTALALTLGDGVRIFTLDPRDGAFRLTTEAVAVPRRADEFAVNASNARYWEGPVRAYVADCVQGADGPRGRDFNMRWIASLVAEAYRILVRGGVFLYPADRRPGYRNGRLRLVYEANPIALLLEQGGGAATDGVRRILDLAPEALHQRTPLVFGSAEKVARVARYHDEPHSGERSPLFNHRGLLSA
jgi:fructose-1,6-bisphosphatase I